VIQAPNLNFDWLAHGFGLRDSVPPAELTTAKQIHSARVLDACGKKGEQIGEGDAIISSEPGVAVGIRTADCVPILLVDSNHRMVASIHAGWRGTAANIVGATVAEMRSRGAVPEDLRAAIGPSIGSCCYEVGPEVTQALSRWQPEIADRKIPTKVSLPAINEVQLREAGVSDIWISGECTYCNRERFFSFRREREEAGRMLTFVSRLA
jgi:hypothetical protein